jgi:NAD(P)-dependent dehydrogenase (short-subunit alcohol dehydrogenase family)
MSTRDPAPACADLRGRVAVVTGASGVLGGAMAAGLAAAGARVGVLARNRERIDRRVTAIVDRGGDAHALVADVLDRGQLEDARDEVLERWDRIDLLVNAAGGNVAAAVLAPEADLFSLSVDAFRAVVELNALGTLLPCQVFGPALARSAAGDGTAAIVNVSSMTAQRAVTRVGGYGAAKAAVDALTRWLALEAATRYGGRLRVNAIAPGFFVGDQNRRLLMEEDGTLTARGRTIVDRTPMGRFGEPDELIGTLLWLCGDGSSFVTGAVIPVDGGFSASGGV